MSDLNELRAEIEQEAPDIGKRPYSHNIVRVVLCHEARKTGHVRAR